MDQERGLVWAEVGEGGWKGGLGSLPLLPYSPHPSETTQLGPPLGSPRRVKAWLSSLGHALGPSLTRDSLCSLGVPVCDTRRSDVRDCSHWYMAWSKSPSKSRGAERGLDPSHFTCAPPPEPQPTGRLEDPEGDQMGPLLPTFSAPFLICPFIKRGCLHLMKLPGGSTGQWIYITLQRESLSAPQTPLHASKPTTDFASSVQAQDGLWLLTLLPSGLPQASTLPPGPAPTPCPPLSPSPPDRGGGAPLGLRSYPARGALGMPSSEQIEGGAREGVQ